MYNETTLATEKSDYIEICIYCSLCVTIDLQYSKLMFTEHHTSVEALVLEL